MNARAQWITVAAALASCGVGQGDVAPVSVEEVRQQLAAVDGAPLDLSRIDNAKASNLTHVIGIPSAANAAVAGPAKIVAARLQAIAAGSAMATSPGHFTFGPRDEGALTWRLTAESNGARASWALQARLRGASDLAYQAIGWGWVESEAAGDGVDMNLDLDAWHALDASQRSRGTAAFSLTSLAGAVRMCLSVRDFTPDAKEVATMTLEATFEVDPAGEVKGRFAGMTERSSVDAQVRVRADGTGRLDSKDDEGNGRSSRMTFCFDPGGVAVFARDCNGAACGPMVNLAGSGQASCLQEMADGEPACAAAAAVVAPPAGGYR